MFKPAILLVVSVTCFLIGCAHPQKPQPLSITASDAPFSQTVGEDLIRFETLSDLNRNDSLIMLGQIVKYVEITSGIPTEECPHVHGNIISGSTAHQLLINAVKQYPELASERINAVLKKIMPLPTCIEGSKGRWSATFTSENNDPIINIQY